MRALVLIPALAALIACESDITTMPVTVQWMEWPEEVPAATPFDVRLIVTPPACHPGVFRPGISSDQSAVTFAPYFLVKRSPPVCPPIETRILVPYFALDTTGTAPGLVTSFARTFEMRAAADVYAPTAPMPIRADLSQRTFGEVTVRLSNPDTTRRNAAGPATMMRDTIGCALLRPVSYYAEDATYMLEDQADTVGLNFAFVRGYIHQAAAPVCGQTTVFHLESRN